MKVLVQATTRAGGDLYPVAAVVGGLVKTGHAVVVLCDAGARTVFVGMGAGTILSGPEYEVGPVVKASLRETAGREPDERQEHLKASVDAWSAQLAPHTRGVVGQVRPQLVLTSLFGTCVGHHLTSEYGLPWAAINSTFYIGPNPPRPLARDFSERAADVFRYSVVPYLDMASLVLHATDPVFDYDPWQMPRQHRYVGPLLWELPGRVPDYLGEPGEPWVLCTLSSLAQDDLPIARAAIDALGHSGSRRRLVVTVGPGHTVPELDRAHALEAGARVFAEQYIPHSSVLERGQLLISHAGHGSVMKALRHGVPMVLVPWSRDQFGVAARAESMGAARVIPKEALSAHAMAEAVDRVLSEPLYATRAAEAARRLRSEDPVRDAVDLIEQASK